VINGLLEDFKSLLDEKLPEHNFSDEVVANVSKAIGDAIKSKSEEYQLKLKEVENERGAIAEAEANMKKEVEELKLKLEESSSQVEGLSQQIHTIKAEEAFNQRMAKISETYTLSEDDQKIIAAELQALDLGEQPFEDYSSKLSVVLAHKSKES
jgi:predicted nuclease with TOPRIM domain